MSTDFIKYISKYLQHNFRNDTYCVNYLCGLGNIDMKIVRNLIHLIALNLYFEAIAKEIQLAVTKYDFDFGEYMDFIFKNNESILEYTNEKTLCKNDATVKLIVGLILDYCMHSCLKCLSEEHTQPIFKIHFDCDKIVIAYNYCESNDGCMRYLPIQKINENMCRTNYLSSLWPAELSFFSLIHYLSVEYNGPKIRLKNDLNNNVVTFLMNSSLIIDFVGSFDIMNVSNGMVKRCHAISLQQQETKLYQDEKSTSPLILLVDDNPIILQILKGTLKKKLHHEIRAMQNAIDAYNFILIHMKDIACILLDIEMPVLNGIELLRSLRELKIRLKNLEIKFPNVIIVSGNDDKKDYCLNELKCFDYLLKPVDCALLTSTVERAI